MNYDEIQKMIEENFPDLHRFVIDCYIKYLGTSDGSEIRQIIKERPDLLHSMINALDQIEFKSEEFKKIGDELKIKPEIMEIIDKFLEDELKKKGMK